MVRKRKIQSMVSFVKNRMISSRWSGLFKDENDSEFDGESSDNESNDDEPEMNYTSLDPWEVKEM